MTTSLIASWLKSWGTALRSAFARHGAVQSFVAPDVRRRENHCLYILFKTWVPIRFLCGQNAQFIRVKDPINGNGPSP